MPVTTSTTYSLTSRQQRAVDSVLASREKEAERVRAISQGTFARVRRALDLGVPAIHLASRLGVSRARVYQMRDEAIAYEAEHRSG